MITGASDSEATEQRYTKIRLLSEYFMASRDASNVYYAMRPFLSRRQWKDGLMSGVDSQPLK